ncbi:MAG: phosphoribosylformylglycinamidine synthase subunit PurL [Fimbriimonadaceae bacterium]|nr:phosphoribosylformylglycinamidine synthase subunit PurL [Fimbriimonadaceae bacterium]
MPALSPQVYRSMGLTDEEYAMILELVGRDLTLTECGMFAVMWSEHCGYKHSRPVLAYFKRYKEALEGAGFENAGVVPIGDNLGIAMKVESHNHPSAVEPYQGAATGVGGIIRDIFTMGARPIAALNSLRFGPIRDGEGPADQVARSRRIFEGVVAGIAGYGNCVGVPTVAGEVSFHPRYAGNPLVNAMCVGIVELDKITTAAAAGPGNPVIYLGSPTGKDGIHGATFASEDLDEEGGADKRPNVQIGDPFAEKVLIEATLEALETGAIVAIQDMGAAGLTCSTIEMSGKSDCGMEVDLDLVPAREPNMSAYELMLSESQERMLCVAAKGRENEVIEVFRKWGAPAAVIGHVTDDGIVTVRRYGKIEAQLRAKHLTDTCPTYSIPFEEPPEAEQNRRWTPAELPDLSITLEEAAMRLLASPSIASKEWVYRQYDQQVQTQTALLPGVGDAAVLAPRGTRKGLAFKIDGNGFWTQQDPYAGGVLAVCEAARNVACTGAMPAAVTDGLNFGNPTQAKVAWQFDRAVKGIADAAEALETPVISGNVSFYNQSGLGEILPTPMIGMMGILENAGDRIGMGLPQSQAEIVAVWPTGLDFRGQQGLGASAFVAEIHGQEAGVPILPDLAGERKIHRFLSTAVHAGLPACAHDVSEGGTVIALAEMCMTGQTGCRVQIDGSSFRFAERDDAALFGEVPGLVLVAVDASRLPELRAIIEEGLEMEVIGRTTPDDPTLLIERGGRPLFARPIAEMEKAYRRTLPEIMNRTAGSPAAD